MYFLFKKLYINLILRDHFINYDECLSVLILNEQIARILFKINNANNDNEK